MKIYKERMMRSHPNLPAEVYYSARMRVRTRKGHLTYHGWGDTPAKAKLDLLWQMGRRRTSPNMRS